MSDNILVSVIMPVYNRENTIRKAINSVLAQRLQNFELLVIDDGSGDNTREAIQTFSDKRVKYFYKNTNTGPGATRNLGLREAQGKYIAYLDSDDEFLPDYLSEMVHFLEDNPLYDCVYCLHETVDENGHLVWRPEYGQFNKMLDNSKKYHTYCSIVSSDLVHRKDCLEKTGYFSEDRLFEDWGFWIRLWENGKCGYLSKKLVKYNIHDQNITGQISLANTYKDFILHQLRQYNYTIPYEDYILDSIKVITMFAAKAETIIIWALLDEYKKLFPGDPAVYTAGAHAAFYTKDFTSCRQYCDQALAILPEPVSLYEKNLYFLCHYLITASCIGTDGYCNALAKYHFVPDIKKLRSEFLSINLKMLRYFGGMFFPIAMRLIRAYNIKGETNDL